MNEMVKTVNLVMQKNIMRNVIKVRISRQILTFLKILSAKLLYLKACIKMRKYAESANARIYVYESKSRDIYNVYIRCGGIRCRPNNGSTAAQQGINSIQQ